MAVNETKSNFNNYLQIYENNIIPKFKVLEQKRIDLKRKNLANRIIVSAMIFIAFALFFTPFVSTFISANYTNSDNFLIFSMLSVIIVCPVILFLCTRIDIQKENQEFKKILKNNVKDDILKIFGDIKWTKHDKKRTRGYNDDVFQNLDRSGLFTDFDELYIDDEFNCVHKGVPFNIYEVKLNKHGSRNSYYTVFEGIAVTFKYDKKIKNRTVVSTKGNHTKKQNFLISLGVTALSSLEIFKHGYSHIKLIFAIIIFIVSAFILYKHQKREEPLNKITLEDPRFIKKFDVYSSDETEARYLISPLFMELLNKFTTAFNSKKLKCSFCDDNFIIAITTKKDCFEIGNLYTSLNSSKYIFKFYRELKSIYNMIEYFELDKRF